MTISDMVAKIIVLASGAAAFPPQLECTRALEPGVTIMSASAALDSSRMALFERNGVEIACGGTYTSGETLTAKISDITGGIRYIFDLSGGTFAAGCETGTDTCGGERCVFNTV